MLRLRHITFACEGTRAVAEFWAAVLGYEVVPSDTDCFARGEGPELFFKRMRKSPTIELPIHLDVNVPDREAEDVLRDPEGNPFCVEVDVGSRNHPCGEESGAAAPTS